MLRAKKHKDIRKHKISWMLVEAIPTQLISKKVSKIALKLYKQVIFAGSSIYLWLLNKRRLLYCEYKLSRSVAITEP